MVFQEYKEYVIIHSLGYYKKFGEQLNIFKELIMFARNAKSFALAFLFFNFFFSLLLLFLDRPTNVFLP